MEEPPAKRARRTDSTAMWEKNDASVRNSPRPQDDDREPRHKGTERGDKRREGEHRRRSRSRERNDRKRERSRSPDMSDRDRDKNRDRGLPRDSGRDRDREGYGRRDYDRSRSRDRHRGSKEHAQSRIDHIRRRSRSRSPARNGVGPSVRARSPPRGPRMERDRPPHREKPNDVDKRAPGSKPMKPETKVIEADQNEAINGHKSTVSDENDEEALLRKIMGFSTFRSTQNTKVPGNNIYGVRKEKKTEYRQYMNRVGGFNRPLSPTR